MDVARLIKREGKLRGLRKNTIKTYVHCVKYFLRIIHKEPFSISKKDIENWILKQKDLGKSDNTNNVHLNALRFFYENVLKKKLTVRVNNLRIRKRLPDYLTQKEVKSLLCVISNSKQKLIVSLLYAAGMRVSELVTLKVKDLMFEQGCGKIVDGKGGKDRFFVIPKVLKDDLLLWIKTNGLEKGDYLFSGQLVGSHYTSSSVRMVLKDATKKAKISKKVHPHMLRHSFATHLIENGYAVSSVQPLLGHSRVETTMIYVHMANARMLDVESPLDNIV